MFEENQVCPQYSEHNFMLPASYFKTMWRKNIWEKETLVKWLKEYKSFDLLFK